MTDVSIKFMNDSINNNNKNKSLFLYIAPILTRSPDRYDSMFNYDMSAKLSGEPYKHTYHMVKDVSENGICVGIYFAKLMENIENPNAFTKKLNNLGTYGVSSPKLTKSSELDTYYKDASTLTNDFIGNLGNLVDCVSRTTQTRILISMNAKRVFQKLVNVFGTMILI